MPSVQAEFIPPLLSGPWYGSLSITEPGAGSDAKSLRTTAVLQPDGTYRLDGSKTFVSSGDVADVIVCFAKTTPDAAHGGISAFAVRGDSHGLTRGSPFHKLGMRGSTTAELFFDGTPVPEEQRLGAEGEGWSVLSNAVVKSRISAAAQGVGIARGAYAHALAHLTRLGPIAQDVSLRLGRVRSAVLQGRLLLHAVARHVDGTSAAPTAHIAMLKQQCTDLAWHVCVELMALLGRDGDHRAVGVERYLRDGRVTQIYDGTNEIQTLLIARDTDRRLRSTHPHDQGAR
jgi:alkylation response protein AidB-like acyl-CoA dehydrogenase